MNQIVMTTSWDDGHPSDNSAAELLHKFQFKGTFYIPSRNCEGLPVLSNTEIRSIAGEFEIGGHTNDHIYLDTISLEQATSQILAGKYALEDCISKTVEGFAYPGGRYNEDVKGAVSQNGFQYARTIENFRHDRGVDQFALPTTLQLFPHSRTTYLKNFAKHGRLVKRFGLFATTYAATDLPSQLRNALDLTCKRGGVFHLWGHSWELNEIGGWKILEDFLRYASERVAPKNRLSNGEVFQAGGFT